MAKKDNGAETLSTAQQIAVAKAVTENQFKAAKKDFPEGSENVAVDFTVHISGLLNKGKDNPNAESWTKAKYDVLAAVALSHMNAETRQSVLSHYREVMREADTAEEKEVLAAERDKLLDDVKDDVESLKTLSTVYRHGTVTGKVTIELV